MKDELRFYSHPRHLQDRWVIEEVLPGRRDGFFVDAGAGPDGVTNSNSYALESQLGWRGICIEPHPDRFAELAQHRPGPLENVCLTEVETEVEFVLNHQRPGTSGVVSEMNDASRAADYDPRETYRTIAVPGVPLQALLRKHQAPPVIDYLSIDIEGSEWVALKNFPLDEYTFRCMTVERNSSRYPQLRRLLEANGYLLAANYCSDDFYVHESTGYRPGLGTRIQTAARRVARNVTANAPALKARGAVRELRRRLGLV